MSHLLKSFWSMLFDVLRFWKLRLIRWWTCKSPIQIWFRILLNAKEYEEWEEAALQLDVLLGNDLWRQNPTSKYYDYRLIYERLQSIIVAREQGNFLQLVNLLRSGLVRNLGNITTPRLFNRAFAGTKLLIEDYVTQVAKAISDVTNLPTTQGVNENASHNFPGLSNQAKLNLLHDTRQAFGRSTLVLQGGAIFGLCHLGVVKALLARGLLPRILAGTGTGALIAALVGTHTEDELPKLLSGESIDLRVFGTEQNLNLNLASGKNSSSSSWWSRIAVKSKILTKRKYFLDVGILEDCVWANVGDLTFEEAYNRTKRVLNITVATTGKGGVPNLLNHLTAPNVLIWTAAVASNASSPSLYGSSPILKCKDSSGAIIPWSVASETMFRPWTHVSYSDRESPLTRITELFNVNHFIVSQARPHLIPFLQSDMRGPSLRNQRGRQTSLIGGILRLIGMEFDHRTHQLETLGLLPLTIRRFLVNEEIPGTAITLAPEISLKDIALLLEQPKPANIKYWILRGEKSVWPAIGALKVRCAIETELDRGYQIVRSQKAAGIRRRNSVVESNNSKMKSKERVRAESLSGKW